MNMVALLSVLLVGHRSQFSLLTWSLMQYAVSGSTSGYGHPTSKTGRFSLHSCVKRGTCPTCGCVYTAAGVALCGCAAQLPRAPVPH